MYSLKKREAKDGTQSPYSPPAGGKAPSKAPTKAPTPDTSPAALEEVKTQLAEPSQLPKEADGPKPTVTRIQQTCGIFQAFRSDTALVDLILRQAPADALLGLRATCHDFYDTVTLYLQRLLINMPFMTLARLGTNIDFWYPAVKFFFHDLVQLRPIDRLTYALTTTALLHNRAQGFPLSYDQIVSRCLVSLDALTPAMIQVCDHDLPQRHTCSISKKYNVPTQAFSDVLSLPQFLAEYRLRASHASQDELLWAGQEQGAYLAATTDDNMATLLLETFLHGLETIVKQRLGQISYRRTELIANGGFFIRHRIWIQATFSWGWEDSRPCAQRAKAKQLEATQAVTKKAPKKWTVRLPPSTNRSPTPNAPTAASKQKAGARKKDEPPKPPPGQHFNIFLTIADHFSWDG